MKRLVDNRILIVIIMAAGAWVLSGCVDQESDVGLTVASGDSSSISFQLDDPDLEFYEGLPVGFTEAGYPWRGNPDAPLTLIEYSDYLCPFCGRYFSNTLPSLLELYAYDGQVKFEFRDFPLASLHPSAPAGHASGVCVAEQGAALYWEMHDALFARQGEWSGLRDPGEFTASLAESIGVDMRAYRACMAAGESKNVVDKRVAEAQALGFGGTPTFQVVDNESGEIYPLVGAQPAQVFVNMLNSLLSGDGAPDVLANSATIQASNGDPAEISEVTFEFDGDLESYKGLPAGFTEEGYPFLGNPEAAITLVEFSDYLCPFCGRHFSQTYPALLDRYASGGEVNFVFRDYPLASLHPTAPIGHAAALCVAEQGAALFWEMHDQLFAGQNQWSNLPDPTQFLAGVVEQAGADMKAYEACMDAGDTIVLVDGRVAEGQALGFSGTPTFQVIFNESDDIHEITGAQPLDVFVETLDTLLAGETLPEPDEPAEAELPYWASAEGLTPDPNRPGYTLAGDAYKGDPDAEVVVVEYSDYQCPACQSHAMEVQPELDEQLVETGDIMWVFKPLPLKDHQQALDAAIAAECAGDQGRYWDMHDLLFASTDSWSVDDPEEPLLQLAEQLQLDTDLFAHCLSGRAALERVVGDMYDAQSVVSTTPSFVVLRDGRGSLLNGSRPADEFLRILLARLEAGESG